MDVESRKELEILELINSTLQGKVNSIEAGGQRINSLNEFEKLIIESNVTAAHLENLVFQLVGSFPSLSCKKDDFPTKKMKRDLIQELKKFLEEWPETNRFKRPIFINDLLGH